MANEQKKETKPKIGCVWRVMALGALFIALAIGVLAFCLHPLADWLVMWYLSVPSEGAAKEILIGLGGVAVVVWTGALVAFQLRGVSVELQGALLLLEYAFVGPFLGLMSSGPVLRTIAFLVALYFLSRAVVHVLMYVIFRRIIRPKVVAEPSSELLESPIGRQLIHGMSYVVSFPALYSGICALSSIAVAIYPTNVTVAWASLAALVGGLNLVLRTIEKRAPQSDPKSKAEAEKLFDRLIAKSRNSADALNGRTAAPNNEPMSSTSGTEVKLRPAEPDEKATNSGSMS